MALKVSIYFSVKISIGYTRLLTYYSCSVVLLAEFCVRNYKYYKIKPKGQNSYSPKAGISIKVLRHQGPVVQN